MASDSEASEDLLNMQNEEGWEDAEPDHEDIRIVSLLDDQIFADIQSMVQHCKATHKFDLVATINDLNLDFYGRIKLVNYIRHEVKKSNTLPDLSSADVFMDDKFLQPVLEDDALLFSLDDLQIKEQDGAQQSDNAALTMADANERIKELESHVEQNQAQFEAYRASVDVTMDRMWRHLGDVDTALESKEGKILEDQDHRYFDSYSYSDIHETMLKDTIRTNAYRDFIYENKHLFKDKIVLDVGCGTGILSMFCAKAGASRVFAVDNSKIIEKAKLNIANNGLSDTITCIRGKIEDLTLPVDAVDIIVSEWMGYCLLYEAMLNSVLWARDKYLRPDGLMVPSHCILQIAPLADAEYVSDNVEFWYDVYGFDMSAMMDKIYDDILIRSVQPKNLASVSSPFRVLSLHTVRVSDLAFLADFSVKLKNDIENLDGWVIWFDTFFLPSRTSSLSIADRAEDWSDGRKDGIAFTTGPFGKETHWHSGIMLIDRHQHPPSALTAGTVISGSVRYTEDAVNKRNLEIEVTWHIEESNKRGQQLWHLL